MKHRLLGALLTVSLLLPVLFAGALLPRICGMCASTCCCRPAAADGSASLSCPSSSASGSAAVLVLPEAVLPAPVISTLLQTSDPVRSASTRLRASLAPDPPSPPPRSA